MTSKILNNIHESVKNLHNNDIVDNITMRKFDELCLDSIEPLSKSVLKKLRLREKVSQPVFAKFLNVSPSTIKKWESGEKHPGGAALRLLHIIKDHGIAIIVNRSEYVESDEPEFNYNSRISNKFLNQR